MKRLVTLQMRYDVSFLVITHDTTPATTRTLVSLADSEIALGNPDADKSKTKKDNKTAESMPAKADKKNSNMSFEKKYPSTPPIALNKTLHLADTRRG